MNRYRLLAILAMVTVPLAPAALFGWNLYLYLLARNVPVWLAICGGVAGAVSLELVGILAGHMGTVLLKKRDWRVCFPAVAMVFYVWFGWTKTPEYGGVFVLAALVYLLAALQNETDEDEQRMAAVTAVRQSFDLEQEAKDREHARQMETQQAERAAANELQVALAHEQAQVAIAQAKADVGKANAEARAKLAQPIVKPTKVHGVSSEPAPLSGKALEIYTLLRAQPGATNTEIGELAGVSRQYVGKVRKELNGAVTN